MTQENNGGNWSQQVWQQSQAPTLPQSAAAAQVPTQPQAQAQAPAQPAPQAHAAARPQAQPAYQQRPQYGYAAAPSAQQPPVMPGAVPSMPAAAAAPAAQPKKRGWIVALTAVVLMFVLMFYGMHSCTAAFSSVAEPLDAMSGMASGGGSEATWGDTVAIIEMTGSIDYDWTNCSPEGLKAQLDKAEENPDIKAVVLRVNSGGGVATAGEEMAAHVAQFSKPIVVSSASTNASAAYEISSQADYIFVGKTTMIGSIGTALQLTDLSGLYEKLGINIENITSAESKDSSYGTRPLSDEERAHYQALVNQINETFIETVAEGRGMTVEEVRALATGMTFSGIDAVENGLADGIGGLEDALDKAAELAGVGAYDIIYLEPSYSYDLYSLLGMEADDAASLADALVLKEMGNGFNAR